MKDATSALREASKRRIEKEAHIGLVFGVRASERYVSISGRRLIVGVNTKKTAVFSFGIFKLRKSGGGRERQGVPISLFINSGNIYFRPGCHIYEKPAYLIAYFSQLSGMPSIS